MERKNKILAIVMARSKSKGLKDKNLKKIKNIPLLALPGILAKKSKLITKIIISTDSKKYGKVAKKNGIDFFFLRKKSLSGSKIADHLVLRDAVIRAEKFYNTQFNLILSMPPTSPLRSKSDIEKCIKKMRSNKFDSVWTVSKIDLKYHPDKQLQIKKNKLNYYSSNGKNIHYRQKLKHTYFRNGCAYVIKRDILLNKNKGLLTNKSGYVIVKNPQVSIDDKFDLAKVRKIFNFSQYK